MPTPERCRESTPLGVVLPPQRRRTARGHRAAASAPPPSHPMLQRRGRACIQVGLTLVCCGQGSSSTCRRSACATRSSSSLCPSSSCRGCPPRAGPHPGSPSLVIYAMYPTRRRRWRKRWCGECGGVVDERKRGAARTVWRRRRRRRWWRWWSSSPFHQRVRGVAARRGEAAAWSTSGRR